MRQVVIGCHPGVGVNLNHVKYELAYMRVLYLAKMRMFRVVLALSVLEKLAQGEYRSLKKQFGDDAANTEDVHSPVHASLPFRLLTRSQKPLGSQIACPPSRKVKIEREVGRVILRKMGGLVCRRKISQIEPVPRCDEDVFGLDVTVVDVFGVTISYSGQQLEGEPFLLDLLEKWSCTQSVVQRAVNVLSNQVAASCCFDDSVIRQSVGNVC